MAYLRTYNLATYSGNTELPFTIQFNFEKVIQYWEELAEKEKAHGACQAKSVLDRIQQNAPALLQGFSDTAIITQYEAELKALLAPLFPTLTTMNDIKGLVVPFLPIVFNPTQRLSNIMNAAGEDGKIDMHLAGGNTYINACIFILNFKYSAQINNKRTFYFDIPDQKTGTIRHYRGFINGDFSSFKVNKKFKPLTQEEISELTANITDVDLWKEKIPPNSFTYEGFALIKLFDVTVERAISALKEDLLKKDALQSPKIVECIRKNISLVLGIQNLQLGFSAYDRERDTLKSLGHGFWNSLSLSPKIEEASQKTFCIDTCSLLFKDKEVLVLSNTAKKGAIPDSLKGRLATNNIQSYIAIPLKYNDEVIGVFELGSEVANELNPIMASHLDQIIPLFTTALKRFLDEIETQLEAIVQEQFTAIHPSVSWRFFDAAENLVEQQQTNTKATIEDIVFAEVYPLFGQSDIKGSSTERNSAIQADMVEQLTLAKNLLDLAIKKYHLPIYNQLKQKIVTGIRKMKKGLGAGDEIEVLDFLRQDIYPVFKYFRTLDEEMNEAVERYENALDPELEVVYKKRKDYEQSVQLINNSIAEYLGKSQLAAQKMFPHYFEKYKTDGVEHNMYIGESIVGKKTFNQLHLQNLRLWQLMTICEIENLMEHIIKPQLKTPLDIASLILVHHNPITIKFQQEEKRFDVEGTYNIRYEIIKKRIDKAVIKGTKERLTQPNTIAIVYSQDKEAREYKQYLDYLQSIKYIKNTIEWLDLNDMQGVTGLKAMRVEVIYQQQALPRKIYPKLKRQVVG